MNATIDIPVCAETDVAEGRLTYVEVGNRAFLLTRAGGELRAYRNLCKHQFLVMEDCRIEDGTFECPYHTVRYSLATGEVADDSGFMGIDALTRYRTRVEDGRIILEVPRDERL